MAAQVEDRKVDGEAEPRSSECWGRVRSIRPGVLPFDFGAGAARVGGPLQIEAREIGSLQRAQLRLGLFEAAFCSSATGLAAVFSGRQIPRPAASAGDAGADDRDGRGRRRQIARRWRGRRRPPAAPGSIECARRRVRLRLARHRRRAAVRRCTRRIDAARDSFAPVDSGLRGSHGLAALRPA